MTEQASKENTEAKPVVVSKVHSKPVTTPQGISITRNTQTNGIRNVLATGLAIEAALEITHELFE